MLEQFYFINYIVANYFHTIIFFLFGFSAVRFFVVKYSPYSTMYIAMVALMQSVYNGCAVTDIVNFFASKSGQPLMTNEFLFVFFDWYWPSRILMFALAILMLYHSYLNWNKPATILDFSRIIRFSSLTSFFPSLKNK